jgi:DNA-binding NtrC family response regulator
MRLGAENFLTKPVSFDHLELAADKAYEKSALRRQARYLAERGIDDDSLASLGDSAAAQELARQLALLAAGSAPILLTGETGTGKGRTAKLVHGASPRAAKPFVAINCAGLTPTFLDTELFGHEKGAFTDAKVAKPGLYEVADGGTIFLDEIGDLAPELQPKLLTVLETNRFRRLGGTREIEVDVRLIAATHRDLGAEVKKGRFREDLYYRLAVLPVHLPSLRERDRTEVAQLAIRLVHDLHRRNRASPARVNADALACLTSYAWPGNVRELRNVLERAMLIAGNVPALMPKHLPAELQPSSLVNQESISGDASLEAVTRRHILQVLEHAKGNRLQAARMLGITRSTLYKRLGEYGVERTKTVRN